MLSVRVTPGPRQAFFVLLAASLLLSSRPTTAQQTVALPDEVWQRIEGSSPLIAAARTHTLDGQLVRLDRVGLSSRLAVAPLEGSPTAASAPAELLLPLPDGGFGRFSVVESPIMEPGLASRYPQIRTYALRGLDNLTWIGRMDTNPGGISAILATDEGTILIEQMPDSDSYYSFYERAAPGSFCSITGNSAGIELGAISTPGRGRALRDRRPIGVSSPVTNPSGDNLRTYLLAVSTTAEYYAARGNNDFAVAASIISIVNQVNLFYEAELAIRFSLIGNLDALFSTDPTDFTNNNECTMRGENVTFTDGILDDDDYDIGHVFGSGSGGCAGGSNVCVDGSKANGASNLNIGNPVINESFSGYRLVLHELGHQFGASHIWSGLNPLFMGDTGNCTAGQFAAGSAYEPGGGTTTMAYAGTCGNANNLQTSTVDTYFNTHSFDQIIAYSTTGNGDDCPATAATGNTAPDVDAGPDFTIPRGTPFVLDGSATDAEGDPLTYTWEQYDLAAGQFVPGVDPGVGPLFRSLPPGSATSRTLPQLSDILNNTTTLGELLPTMDRTVDPLTFRLTARDNRLAGGGVDYDVMEVTVEGAPFRILSPNGGESLGAGCVEPVTWQVGGGDVAAEVDLLLSTDSGLTTSPLLAATDNDGSAPVALPCDGTSSARVRANAVDNIFFDISDDDFTIAVNAPDISAAAEGGEVDAVCEIEVEFEATITDDCSINSADVSVSASVLTANATIDAPVFNLQQIDAATVDVVGSVLVSSLQGGPAIVRVEIAAVDGCGVETIEVADADVVDATPPSIEALLDPELLWPPGHQLVDITATVVATDNCPNVTFALTNLVSDEPENGAGDGNTAPDIVGAELGSADLEFELRAERQGFGDGRTYTATYVATDGSGNEATDSAEVLVPKSRGGQ